MFDLEEHKTNRERMFASGGKKIFFQRTEIPKGPKKGQRILEILRFLSRKKGAPTPAVLADYRDKRS